MKKTFTLLLALLLGIAAAGCGKQDDADKPEKENDHKFVATVIELSEDSVLVEPVETEVERQSSDRIFFHISKLEDIGAEVGSIVEVSYHGEMKESDPAQITAKSWEISRNLRHLEYMEEWLDKEKATHYDDIGMTDLRITEIYSDCFLAVPVSPLPSEYKLNGVLPDEWCVGDQIRCTYENIYYDEDNWRYEADFSKIEESDWEPDPNADAKPVIYLYPEEETEVSVKLDYDGELTCTYPAYENGWTVTAQPDGTLKDEHGQTYNYLYWEGVSYAPYDFSRGFCVAGEDTAAFLEEALADLGLTRREANEFIVYWLPLMESNPYNLISFQGEAYTDRAELTVDPAPETEIRVFMAWQALEEAIEIEPQELAAPQRQGFTLVEWGGTEVK